MGYEEVIHVLGDFGRYQKRIYFLLCLPAILCAFHKLANVFLLAEPLQRCRLPFETKDVPYRMNESIFSQYYPYDSVNKKYSECDVIINNVTEKCSDYIYDHSVYGYTTVIEYWEPEEIEEKVLEKKYSSEHCTCNFFILSNYINSNIHQFYILHELNTAYFSVYEEIFTLVSYHRYCQVLMTADQISLCILWDLTCSKTYLIATGNALFMFGVMLGSIVFGQLSDRYGRKLIFFISLILQVTAGILASIAPEFWSFTFARMIIGSTTSGVFLVAYVIALEMVSANKRPIAGTVCQMFFSVGYMLTALFAVYIDNWRSLQLALSLPGLCFLCYWWFIPESVRWLLSKNRIEEAKELIQHAAKENRVHVTDSLLDEMLVSEVEKSESPEKKDSTVLDICKYPKLRKRALIIFFDWFACNITYYGLSWSTNNLGGNPYINFVLSGLVEIPAYTFLILVLNRWGRKKVQCGCMIVAGMALLSSLVISHDQHVLMVISAMIGKLAVTSAYGTIYIFSTEQFPTVIRNAGLGACSTCARVGSVMAPYINVLNKIWHPLPLVIFGIITLVGGVLSLLLPETLNRQLPETMEEGESFGQKKTETEMMEEEPMNNVKV